jgi:hypothetical protein
MPVHSIHLGAWDLRTWILVGQVPFLALMLVLYFAGRRRGWAWRPALLATAAFAGGLSLGTAMLPSVLGSMAGGIALWLLAQRLLGLRRPPLAELALGLAAVVAIGRWGCLLNDCCFGKTTDLPWAVRYGAGSATWILHRALGGIAPDAALSLPVHPYPLYESLGLFCWLPLALWLRRRLRSEAALLLFTGAYDLVLRAGIDGTRAMVNVWWGLLGSPWGFGLFQWALGAAALACAGAGLALERRARTAAAPEPATAGEAAPERLWAVFAGLWVIGWLSDAGQTVFLHRVLVAALAAAALALRLPAWLAAGRWLRAWSAPVMAVGLALVLGGHVERLAEAGGKSGTAVGRARGWLYEVDHERSLLVRVGSQTESPEQADPRRAALDLPAAAPATALLPAGRTWLGGGLVGGVAEYRVQESCSNDYVAYDRRMGGGWLQAEHELPAAETSVFWLGGRGFALFESQTKTAHTEGSGADQVDYYTLRSYGGQVWGEWEHPNLTLGIGAQLGLRHRVTEIGSSSLTMADGDSSLDVVARPSFHLRGGFSFLGLDGGAYDRQSFVGYTSAHVGISGAIGRGFTRIRHPDDTAFKYFIGAVVFPGADPDLHRLLFGMGMEAFLSRRLALGLQGGTGEGTFLTGYLRAALGP